MDLRYSNSYAAPKVGDAQGVDRSASKICQRQADLFEMSVNEMFVEIPIVRCPKGPGRWNQ